jgi:hypothetical protein
MLGLSLRPEFRGKRHAGTAIELTTANKTGATQKPAAEFLEITYPSTDLQVSLEAIGPGQVRPVVLIGERGQGKSHLMATLYHALTDEAATRKWLDFWAATLQNPNIAQLPLRTGMHVIGENLHRQRFKHLWELLFARHPDGQRIMGKFQAMGTDVPSDELLLELFKSQPTALILDEFQTWYDGLSDTPKEKRKSWAFNFIQLLSEIASNHPELLVLVVSVRNGGSDAYQQLHRVNPVRVDFKGPNADRDRRRLLLHRLFENRMQIHDADVAKVTAAHVAEYLRLHDVAPSEHQRRAAEVVECWPFAPHLMRLLEDQVLVATDAQETRDLIRILADVYKRGGEKQPILTAADFRLDDEESGIASLLDSVSNQHHRALREKAQRNLAAVQEAVDQEVTPHLSELIGALWLRSLAAGIVAGAEPAELQLDITRGVPVDGNAFDLELNTIVENSFNIHRVGSRLLFKEEENPQAKLLAFARNDKLFADGSDKRQLAKELRYVLGGSEEAARVYRVVVLPETWRSDPWTSLEEADRPAAWGAQIPYLVVPDLPEALNAELGRFLKQWVPQRRNAVRFVLQRAGFDGIYRERELLVYARAVVKADEWKKGDPAYVGLHKKFQGELRAALKERFARFAILEQWNFADPAQCRFQTGTSAEKGEKLLEAVDKQVREHHFEPETFRDFVLLAAQEGKTLAKVLAELQEPRPNGAECIPWLGETAAQERILRLCSQGHVALDVRGSELLQALPGESSDTAWARMRGKVQTGKHLEETVLMLPQAVAHAGSQPGRAGTGANGTPAEPGATGTPPRDTVAPGATSSAGGGSLFTPFGSTPAPGGGTGTLGGNGAGTTTSTATGTGSSTGPSSYTSAVATPRMAPANSALNLTAKLEQWQVTETTRVRAVTLTVDGMSGKELRRLLESLPDGLRFGLTLEQES